MMKPKQKVNSKVKKPASKVQVTEMATPVKSVDLGKYLPAIVCILAFLIYSNTLLLKYALDDRMVVTDNQYTKQGLKGLKDIFTTDSFVGFFGKEKNLLEGGRYRPLSIATFAIENSIFGKTPFISHLINVILYVLSCLLLYYILVMILEGVKRKAWYNYLPFLVTVLFAVHPIHTEVVTNIKGRDELLSFLCSLLALFWILKYVKTGNKVLIPLVFLVFFAAMISKENAITFLAVVPLTLYFFTKAKPADYFISLAAMVFSIVIFFILRYNALGFLFSNHFVSGELLNNPFLNATGAQKYATIILTWGIYLRLLFIPHPLTHDYYPKQIPIVSLSDARVLISLLVAVFLIVYAIYIFRKKNPAGYGILFFIITFSISSNLFFNIGTFMNERFMYAPSMGFAIASCYFIQKMADKKGRKQKEDYSRIIFPLFFAVIFLFSIKTFARNFAWMDDYTLFTTDVKTSVNSAKCNISAGGQTLERMDSIKDENTRSKMMANALKYLKKGVEIHPLYVQGWVLFGNACLKNNDYDNAVECYNNALRIAPQAPDAMHNLLYAAQKANEKNFLDASLKAYRILASQKKDNELYLVEMADCLIKKGKADSSLQIIQTLLEKPNPSYTVYSKAGEIWGRYLNKPQVSLNYLLKAKSLKPDDLSVNENLGIVYAMMGDFNKSMGYFEVCLKKEPDNPRILNNIGLTYANMGQKEKAEEYYQKAKVKMAQ